jgi:hypothetical protein
MKSAQGVSRFCTLCSLLSKLKHVRVEVYKMKKVNCFKVFKDHHLIPPAVRPVGDIVIKKNELLPYCPAELVAKHANEYYQVNKQ